MLHLQRGNYYTNLLEILSEYVADVFRELVADIHSAWQQTSKYYKMFVYNNHFGIIYQKGYIEIKLFGAAIPN